MYAVPNLEAGRVSEINGDVTIANVSRNNVQIGTTGSPCLVMRLSPPYGSTFDQTKQEEDLVLTLDTCDCSQIKFFDELEKEAEKRCIAAFGDNLPFKPIVRDGFVKLKAKKNTDCINESKTRLSITEIGAQDKCIFIIRVTCLWKSATHVGASLRVVRAMLLEKGVLDAVPDFDLS